MNIAACCCATLPFPRISFPLAGILWVLVLLDPGHFFLRSVVAACVLFLLFDPVRAKLEQRISQIFLRERYDLERVIGELRQRLAHTLLIRDVGPERHAEQGNIQSFRLLSNGRNRHLLVSHSP